MSTDCSVYKEYYYVALRMNIAVPQSNISVTGPISNIKAKKYIFARVIILFHAFSSYGRKERAGLRKQPERTRTSGGLPTTTVSARLFHALAAISLVSTN